MEKSGASWVCLVSNDISSKLKKSRIQNGIDKLKKSSDKIACEFKSNQTQGTDSHGF